MSNISKFGKGAASIFWAFGFIFKNGMWLYLLYPILVYIVLLVIGLKTLFGFFPMISDWLNHLLGADGAGSGLLFLAKGYLAIVAGFIVKFIIWILFGFINKYLVMILMSPMYALLSEKVEAKLTGKEYPFSLWQLLKDIARGVAITFRNMFLELILIIVLSLLAFIPLINLITPLLLFLVSSYFIAFSLFDYSCERHRYSYSESIQYVRANRSYLLGLGAIYTLLTFIPLVGYILPPVLGVVGATKLFLESITRQKNDQ
jgi:CysZ protein